jgi:pyruvate formate lyase activating enzyme
MCLWIKDNLGAQTPLHFSRAFPMYQLTSINPTPPESLELARRIALESGLIYVYIGNLPGNLAENTYCPKCNKLLVERRGYFIVQNNIEEGRCRYCGEEIDGVWK